MSPADRPLRDISPRLLERYLTLNGWLPDTNKGKLHRWWFPDPDLTPPVEIFLSLGGKSEWRQMEMALTTISQLRDLPLAGVIADIRALAYDVISSRIPDEYVRNDTIELRIASDYIDRMKDLLAATASAEISGERYVRRVKKEALEYSERCRFGHTFRGSFGFTIESPVGLNDQFVFPDFDADVPLGRKVVDRISIGLHSLRKAALLDDLSPIVDDHNGLSSNMCEVLVDIVQGIGISRLDIDIALSPEWGSRVSPVDTSFTLLHSDVELLQSAAKHLKVEEPDTKSVHVFGRIKRLETLGNSADLLDQGLRREIEVVWIGEDEKLTHVRVNLGPEDYIAALDAHKNGRQISVKGMLERSGRGWRLSEVEELSFLP